MDGTQVILAEVRRLSAQVEALDATIRGNNGEGLVTRVARLHERHDGHGRRLDAHHDDLAQVKAKLDGIARRVMWFAGAAAAIGGFLSLAIPSALARWL